MSFQSISIFNRPLTSSSAPSTPPRGALPKSESTASVDSVAREALRSGAPTPMSLSREKRSSSRLEERLNHLAQKLSCTNLESISNRSTPSHLLVDQHTLILNTLSVDNIKKTGREVAGTLRELNQEISKLKNSAARAKTLTEIADLAKTLPIQIEAAKAFVEELKGYGHPPLNQLCDKILKDLGVNSELKDLLKQVVIQKKVNHFNRSHPDLTSSSFRELEEIESEKRVTPEPRGDQLELDLAISCWLCAEYAEDFKNDLNFLILNSDETLNPYNLNLVIQHLKDPHLKKFLLNTPSDQPLKNVISNPGKYLNERTSIDVIKEFIDLLNSSRDQILSKFKEEEPFSF